MTKVSYTLEPIGDIETNVLLAGGSGGDISATKDGFFITDDIGSFGALHEYGRLFSLHADAKTTPFLISNTEGQNYEPSSDVLKNGTLVTTYEYSSYVNQTVFMALNGPTGSTIKSSFTVPSSGDFQSSPDVAALKDGSYVETWGQSGSSATYILAQHYDFNGNAVSDPVQVNTASGSSAFLPSVAGLSSGGFVVAFSQEPAGSNDTTLSFRIFDAAGRGGEVIDAGTSGTNNIYAAVIGLKDGGFAIAFESDGWNAATSQDDITLQIFNADGTPRTNHIRVNSNNLLGDDSNTVDYQTEPHLTQLKNGNLIVGWTTRSEATDDDLKTRAFDLKGHALTGITTLAGSNDGEHNLSITRLKNGHAAVSFGDSSTTTDNLVGGELQLVRTSVGTKHGETINGDGLTDRISGRSGDDTLFGGHGADVLKGGKGADDMYAGKDNAEDIFVFHKGASSADDQDRIFQFDAHGKHETIWDRIDLSALHVSWDDIKMHHHDDGQKVRVDVHVGGGPDLVIQVKVDDLSHKDFIL